MKDNWIRKNLLTVSDVQRSHVIYGPPIPPLKGCVRYQNLSRIPEFEAVDIPKALHDDLKNVTLCIDFHFVNGVTIFHTISQRLGYRTVSFRLSRSKASIVAELKNVYKKYNSRGFFITDIHADIELKKLETRYCWFAFTLVVLTNISLELNALFKLKKTKIGRRVMPCLTVACLGL